MTRDEWQQVERALTVPYGAAKLRIDGYELALCVQQVKPLKYAITPYVNGEFKGAWLLHDCEERRRFFRPVRSRLWSPKLRASLKKVRKATLKEMSIDPDTFGTYYVWEWPSFGALKRHLIANNQSIELASVDHRLAAGSLL